MLQAGPLLSLSPSFNSYSSSAGNLADIAARVVSELRRESQNAAVFLYDDDDDQPWLHADLYPSPEIGSEPSIIADHDDDDDDDREFEFAVVARETASSPTSADELFLNGQIRPVYPLFGKTKPSHDQNDVVVVANNKGNDKTTPDPPPPPPQRRRQPLRKLMVEEEAWGAAASSSSSSCSEADELDGLKDGTYCVWRPRVDRHVGGGGGQPEERKKSKSTGGTGSRRWKLRGLLLSRSSSHDGKAAAAPEKEAEAEEVLKKKKSFVTYKQEMVGFLANVNGLSRNLHPF